KQLRPEYSFLLRIAVLLTVLFSAVAAFSVLSDKIGESIGDAEINTEGLKLMVKTAGVSVVTEIASAVCRDSSETALAKTAELIGKITIAGMILPVIGEIIKLCVSLCGK
ncbi:stage III sporulation protein AD, partial [human gut metagenome]